MLALHLPAPASLCGVRRGGDAASRCSTGGGRSARKRTVAAAGGVERSLTRVPSQSSSSPSSHGAQKQSVKGNYGGQQGRRFGKVGRPLFSHTNCSPWLTDSECTSESSFGYPRVDRQPPSDLRLAPVAPLRLLLLPAFSHLFRSEVSRSTAPPVLLQATRESLCYCSLVPARRMIGSLRGPSGSPPAVSPHPASNSTATAMHSDKRMRNIRFAVSPCFKPNGLIVPPLPGQPPSQTLLPSDGSSPSSRQGCPSADLNPLAHSMSPLMEPQTAGLPVFSWTTAPLRCFAASRFCSLRFAREPPVVDP